MLEAFGAAGDADVFLNEVVVRLDVLVTERPVFTVAVEGSCFEIPIAETEADAAQTLVRPPVTRRRPSN